MVERLKQAVLRAEKRKVLFGLRRRAEDYQQEATFQEAVKVRCGSLGWPQRSSAFAKRLHACMHVGFGRHAQSWPDILPPPCACSPLSQYLPSSSGWPRRSVTLMRSCACCQACSQRHR